MTKRHLAFDLGAESGRAVVGEIKNGRLTLQEIHRFTTQGMHVNGSIRWDIYRLFSEVKEGIRKYVKTYGNQLATIGIDTWGVDFGLLDKRGQLISIPYHYRDNRNQGTDNIINEKLGNQRLYELTGIQLLQINTLNQMISMIRDKDPALDIADNIMFVGDLLHYFLTGHVCTEYTVASISQLINTKTGEWEDEILNVFDIPDRLKTKMVNAGDKIANVRADLANETGLLPDTIVVAPGVHDTASAFAAVPAKGENWACISSGTWSIMGLEINEPIINQQCFEMNVSNSAGVLGKTLFLKNVMGLWIIQQCKKVWNKKEPNLDYVEIVARAEKAKVFEGMIDPDALVFLNPENAPEAIVKYLESTNQPKVSPDDVGQIARLVFESLALKYRYVFEILKDAANKKIEALHITGGGCKNEMLNQFTSNALGIQLTTGPIEATAAGNILMQAYGVGEINSLEELREVVSNSFASKTYFPLDKAKWECAYRAFLKTVLKK